MKRNRGGERDLDHIILAAIRGLDVAGLEYPQTRAGLILMMDRTFTSRQNEIIVEKAIRWAPRGIVGIDIAGPRPGGERYDYAQVQPMVEEARAAGLGVTIHVGEEGGEMGREEIGQVLELLVAGPASATWILAAGDPGADEDALRGARGRPRDLPDIEPPDESAARRGRAARRVPDVRRERRPVHHRDGRPGDDAHSSARRVRPVCYASAR